MTSRPRWKSPNAQDYTLENPTSELYAKLKALSPIKSFIAHTAVILCADRKLSELLNNACFGHPILAGPNSSLSCGDGRDASSPRHELLPNEVDGETILFELGLEEAFFLCYKLKCLQVFCKGQQEETALNDNDLWKLMLNTKQGFLYQYKAYSHLRMKNWIVRTGLQYGVPFVAYRHHPAQVHAEYAVIVVPQWEKQLQLSSWNHLQGIIRLCGSVAKNLLFLHITSRKLDFNNPVSLELYSVHEVEVKRWLPKKHRMDSGTSSSEQ